MRALLTIFFCAWFLVHPAAWAYTLDNPTMTATTDGSRSDVQAAIDAVSDGWTVDIPAGAHAAYTTKITISGKYIRVRGAGGGKIEGYSESSVSIGTGTKSFVTQEGLDWTAGEEITAFDLRTGGKVIGTVTSYTDSNLVVNATSSSGSGSKTWWAFRGAVGLTRLTANAATGPMFEITKDPDGYTVLEEFDIHRGTATNSLIEMTETAGGYPMILREIVAYNGTGAESVIYCKENGYLIHNFDAIASTNGWSSLQQITGSFLDIQWGISNSTWTSLHTMGSRDSNGRTNGYVEDCDVVGFGFEGFDFSDNSKTVVRYNRFPSTAATSHGPDTGKAGLRQLEWYENDSNLQNGPGDCSTSLSHDYALYIRGGMFMVFSNKFNDIGGTCLGSSKAEIKGQVQSPWRNGGPFACWTGGYPLPHQHGRDWTGSAEVTVGGRIWGNRGSGSETMGLATYSPDQCSNSGETIDTYIQPGRDVLYAAPSPVDYAPLVYPNPNRSGADVTAPIVSTATISSDGTTWTFACSETVTIGSGGNGGFATTISGVTLTYSSGSGTSSLVYTGNRTVQLGESGTLTYTQPGNGVEDSSGNDLVTFTGKTVTNNSSQTGAIPPVIGVRSLPLRISR